jgi:hypothetical protein
MAVRLIPLHAIWAVTALAALAGLATAAPASTSARPQQAPPGTATADDGVHVVAEQWIDAHAGPGHLFAGDGG